MKNSAKRRIYLFIITVICSILIIFIIPLLVLMGLVFLPYRLVVPHLARKFRPDLGSVVSGAYNNLFAVNYGQVPTMNITVLLTVDGVVTLKQVRDRFHNNVLNLVAEDGTLVYGKLKQTLEAFMGYCFFRRADSFELDFHIRAYDPREELSLLPNQRCTESDLQALMGKIGCKPWSVGRSNWELQLVEDVEGEGGEVKTVMLFRVDHAYMDGYCITQTLLKLMDVDSEPPKFPAKGRWADSMCIRLGQMAFLPFKVVWDFSAEVAAWRWCRKQWTLPTATNAQPRKLVSWSTRKIPVEKIKEIKNELRVSYSSVLLTAVTAALAKLMSHEDEDVPEEILVTFPLPKPNHPYGMTNHVASCMMMLPIPSAKSPCTVEEIDKIFRKTVRSAAPLLSELCMTIISLCPRFLAKRLYSALNPSIGLSVMPVLSGTYHFYGHVMTDCIIAGAGLSPPMTNEANIYVGGVNSMQRLMAVLDDTVFPQIFERLPQCIEEEFELMLKDVRHGFTQV